MREDAASRGKPGSGEEGIFLSNSGGPFYLMPWRFVRGTREFSTEYQIVAPRMGTGKHLTIRVEPPFFRSTGEEMNRVVKAFKEKFKFRIGVTPEVEIVEIGKLPRFEGKAKRVIRE